MARTPQCTLTRTLRSSEHAAHRLLMHMCSHIALVAQGLALCVIPYHPCMRTCVWLLECSLFTRLSVLLPPVPLPALPDVHPGA